MGSFSYTCCVSDLPIEYGDKVRFFTLVENPYHHGKEEAAMCCYVYDKWAPRTFPLRAVYNDYGSVEKVQEGPQRDIWFEGLRTDLVSRGTGANTCHDVPTRKDMDLQTFLDAILEGRILVHDQDRIDSLKRARKMEKKMEEFTGKPSKPKLPDGIPTMKRVRAEIQRAGLTNSDGNFRSGLMVSLMHRGFVRVRCDEFDTKKNLKALREAQKVLGRKYATVIMAGRGSYTADRAELLVVPKPLPKGTYVRLGPREKVRHLSLAQAMIREDVWQEMVNWEFKSWSGTYRLSSFLADAHKAWDESVVSYKKDPDFFHKYGALGSPDLAPYTKDQLPFVVGLGTHFKLMVEKNPTKEEVEDFLQTAAEFTLVSCHFMGLRRMWHPSFGAGPQFGEWDLHAQHYSKMHGIAQKIYEKQRAEAEAEEEDMA